MLTEIEKERIAQFAKRTGGRDFKTFAVRCGEMNTVLGYQVEWHLQCPDLSGSPDVIDWVKTVIEDYDEMNPQHNMGRESVWAWMDKHYPN